MNPPERLVVVGSTVSSTIFSTGSPARVVSETVTPLSSGLLESGAPVPSLSVKTVPDSEVPYEDVYAVAFCPVRLCPEPSVMVSLYVFEAPVKT